MTEASTDFANDIYAQTINALKAQHRQGSEDCIRPLAESKKWGRLNRWARTLFPLLYAGLILLGVQWIFGTPNLFMTWIVDHLPQIDPAIKNPQTFAIIRSVHIAQIPLALLGGWTMIGAGKYWRREATVIILVLATCFYLFPQNLQKMTSLEIVPLDLNTISVAVAIIIVVYSYVSYGLGEGVGRLLSLIADTGYPFRKILPQMGGRPNAEITTQAYAQLEQRLPIDPITREKALDYVIAAAQAHLDVSETMNLPWGVILAIISLEAIKIILPTFLEPIAIIPLILGATLGACYIAYHAALQVSVIQAAAKLKQEIPQTTTAPEPSRSFFAWLLHK